MVLSGDLTLGQLIAFRIIPARHPALLRLSTIWQNIQELRVSFERLADVIDTPEESDEVDKSKVMLPPLPEAVVPLPPRAAAGAEGRESGDSLRHLCRDRRPERQRQEHVDEAVHDPEKVGS